MIKFNRGCLLLLLLVSSLGAPVVADNRSCQASIAAMEPNATGFLSNSDDLLLPDQEVMNCFMWQTFAALNWPASQQQPLTGVSVSEIGIPEPNTALLNHPRLWQTYMDVSRFIGRPGSEVPDWGEPASIPEFCVDDKQLTPAMVLTDYLQASPGEPSRGHFALLRDVNGNPIYYQQLVNVAQYNYFIENDLQTVTGQQAFVQNKCSGKSAAPGAGACIQLPQGKLAEQGPLGQNTGATEIKASWRILTQPELARHARSFITSTAYIVEPAEPDSEALPKCSSQVVGLIGLHIIHKDPLKNQFIWSSFEHQNNAPSKGEGSSINDDKPWYSLYRKGCEPDKCGQPNMSPTSITGMTPTQVVRLNPIPDSIDALNRSVQAVFGADSVMRNYELVDVLWTNSARANQESDFRSTNGGRLANTSMETYVQDDNCVSCHLHAKIAKTTDAKALDYHSDFSFVFEQASKAEPQN